MGNDSAQSIISVAMRENQNDIEEQRQIRLAKLNKSARSRRSSETDEQRQNRLQKERERARARRSNETDEQRQNRLETKRERTRSNRMNETEEQRQNRLVKDRERTQSNQMNETEEQRQNRLEKNKERARSSRTNETEEQRRVRLEQQKKRSQASRTKKKLEKRASDKTIVQQQNMDMQFNEMEDQVPRYSDSMGDPTQNKIGIKKKKTFVSAPWPEPISRQLKEACLQKFLQRMSMSVLAETICAVCNVRAPVQQSKKIPVSKIPNIHLLKVSDELKDLIISTQSSTLQNSNVNNIRTAEYVQSNL
jgi:hypothetical protein